MLALKSDDAGVDNEDFRKAGIAAGDVFRFARKATLPDGSEQEIGLRSPTPRTGSAGRDLLRHASIWRRASSSSRPFSSTRTV